jgi:hypothetical protein
MVQYEPKACQFCGDPFIPHPKVGARQIACRRAECQCARKRENLQNLYRSDPGYNYDNVKRYRASHPDYQRLWRQRRKEKLNALDTARKRTPTGQHQYIPASLFVSPKTDEIQTELSSVKTIIPTKRTRPLREIQTELTLYFSVPLSKLTDFLPDARYKPS